MSTDLNNLSLKELKELQSKVAKAIASYEERQKKDAIAQLEEKAREMGFSLAELTGTQVGTKRKRSVSAPKYANPADPTETWTGRGRKPNWMIEALKAGKSPDDLLI
ncbi:H-NS histone family protein [Acidimangrovimonas sediminis]|uniref:H-NS histone family protein n=1 Tax=Acidimangrovimonas sediminis TaxID=2056283 RepID=UPI000C80A1FF|nr:H-NS histone family protein [Acidimangrovimonas sediminis]